MMITILIIIYQLSHLPLTINTTTHIGIYPAVDPLDSTSRMLDPRVIGDLHYQTGDNDDDGDDGGSDNDDGDNDDEDDGGSDNDDGDDDDDGCDDDDNYVDDDINDDD
jgi:hypothetical protein